jgi:hypothetical protein
MLRFGVNKWHETVSETLYRQFISAHAVILRLLPQPGAHHTSSVTMPATAMSGGYGVPVAPAAVAGHLVPAPYNPQAQSAPQYAAALPAPYTYAATPSPYAPEVPSPYPYSAVPSPSSYPYTAAAAPAAYGAVPAPYAAAQQVEMVYVGSSGQGDYVVADAQVV